MALKIYDTLKPQGEYPAVEGKDVSLENGLSVEDAIKALIDSSGTTSTASAAFIGTQKEYEAAFAAGKIPVGCLVVVMEGEDETSILGKAVLGRMKLGQS